MNHNYGSINDNTPSDFSQTASSQVDHDVDRNIYSAGCGYMFKTKNYSLAIKPLAFCVAMFISMALTGCGGGGDSGGNNTGLQNPTDTTTKSVTVISGKA